MPSIFTLSATATIQILEYSAGQKNSTFYGLLLGREDDGFVEMAIPLGTDLGSQQEILSLYSQTYPHLRLIGAFGNVSLSPEQMEQFNLFILVEGEKLIVHSPSISLAYAFNSTEITCIYTAYLSKLASNPQLYAETKINLVKDHEITGEFKQQVKEAFEEIRSAQPVASCLAYEAIHSRLCTLFSN
jgi:hypothetical protein